MSPARPRARPGDIFGLSIVDTRNLLRLKYQQNDELGPFKSPLMKSSGAAPGEGEGRSHNRESLICCSKDTNILASACCQLPTNPYLLKFRHNHQFQQTGGAGLAQLNNHSEWGGAGEQRSLVADQTTITLEKSLGGPMIGEPETTALRQSSRGPIETSRSNTQK